MTTDAPFPMKTELLLAHPVYRRAQAILMTWHSGKLKTMNTSPTQPRQEQKELLKVVNGEGPKRKKEWFWNREREATAAQLLVDFLGCTQCDRAEERMTAWQALQRSVATWDERFADDNDVA